MLFIRSDQLLLWSVTCTVSVFVCGVFFIFKGIGSRSTNISLVDSQVEVFYSILSKL